MWYLLVSLILQLLPYLPIGLTPKMDDVNNCSSRIWIQQRQATYTPANHQRQTMYTTRLIIIFTPTLAYRKARLFTELPWHPIHITNTCSLHPNALGSHVIVLSVLEGQKHLVWTTCVFRTHKINSTDTYHLISIPAMLNRPLIFLSPDAERITSLVHKIKSYL